MEVQPISKKGIQVNESIKDKQVRVINSNGQQLGIMDVKKALEAAYAENLDLVKIAPLNVPPVCKIMDYGKYKFEQAKKEKESKKNQKTMDIKEVRLSLNIDTNDFNTKCKNAIKFLQSHCRVKVSVRFKGRELSRVNLGFDLLKKFEQACKEYGQVEGPFKMESRNAMCTLNPKPMDVKKS